MSRAGRNSCDITYKRAWRRGIGIGGVRTLELPGWECADAGLRHSTSTRTSRASSGSCDDPRKDARTSH
eukprot:scaffold27570_cov34-Tisochrysis_lutea.AAC.4